MTIRSIVTTIARLQDPQTVAPPGEDHGEVLHGPEEVPRDPEEVLQDLAKSRQETTMIEETRNRVGKTLQLEKSRLSKA